MMHRRDFLFGVSTAALTAAWSRAAGSVGMVAKPATASPWPKSSRYLWAGERLDYMWRDIYRRRIDASWFMEATFKRCAETTRALGAGEIDEITAAARMLALHSEALRHRPEPREIPPLPANEVGVDEVMALLRRAIAGEVDVVVDGDIVIDGWRLVGFKSGYGIRSIIEATAPDGRRGRHENWATREGNPAHLLENDEQDALSKLMEGLVPS